MITNALRDRLRCPDCRHPSLNLDSNVDEIVCTHCHAHFPLFRGHPVLLRHDNAVFPPGAYVGINPRVVRNSISRLARFIPSISVNLSSKRLLYTFFKSFAGQGNIYVLVVGCGTQRTWLDVSVAAFPQIHLFYCDIDTTAIVDCYCDAHELPFKNGSFDGIITTAVLEHVLYPERVADELHRVLSTEGILYSELPFMQQVHEGAYDFTRYTLSGHRRLFNRFAEIDSGLVAGPATALVWAVENFALAFFAGHSMRLVIKTMVRLGCFWIKYFDYLFANKPQAIDGASCTYFFGQKKASPVSDRNIIEGYIGAKHLRHV